MCAAAVQGGVCELCCGFCCDGHADGPCWRSDYHSVHVVHVVHYVHYVHDSDYHVNGVYVHGGVHHFNHRDDHDGDGDGRSLATEDANASEGAELADDERTVSRH